MTTASLREGWPPEGTRRWAFDSGSVRSVTARPRVAGTRHGESAAQRTAGRARQAACGPQTVRRSPTNQDKDRQLRSRRISGLALGNRPPSRSINASKSTPESERRVSREALVPTADRVHQRCEHKVPLERGFAHTGVPRSDPERNSSGADAPLTCDMAVPRGRHVPSGKPGMRRAAASRR